MNTNDIVLVLISVSMVISAIGGIIYKFKVCETKCCRCETNDVEAPPVTNNRVPTVARAVWGVPTNHR